MAKGIKTGGRQAGSVNKIKASSRELLQMIFDAELNSGKLQKELKKLSGKDYIDAVIKLSPFTVPKFQNINVDVVSGKEKERLNLPSWMHSEQAIKINFTDAL